MSTNKNPVLGFSSSLGVLLGILSVVMLAKYVVLHGDFVSPLQLMLDFYEKLTHAIFGWAEPLIDRILRPAREYLSLDLHLKPHWKHVFVLLWLYFGTYARVYWSKGEKLSAAFSIPCGFVLALLASTLAGSINDETVASGAVVFFLPIAAMILFEYGISLFNWFFANIMGLEFRALMRFTFIQFALPQALIGAAIFSGLAAIITVYSLSVTNIGLVGLAIYCFTIAVYWMLRALRRVWLMFGAGTDFRSRILQAPGTRIGLLMLATLLGGVLFVAANAGLVLLGL